MVLTIGKSSEDEGKPSLLSLAIPLLFIVVSALYWYATSDRLILLVLAALVLVAFAGVFALYRSGVIRRTNGAPLFLIALSVSGLFYTVVYPPFTVPDEVYHFDATYCASNALMGYGYQSDPLLMRADDARLLDELSTAIGVSDYDHIANGLNQFFADDSSMIEVQTGLSFDLGQNLPQQRLPAALGVTFARLANLGPYYLLYIGRLCNLAFFIVLAYLAYKITPVGKNVLVAVSLLPMTLHLAASYSYDVGIIGLAFVATALVLRALSCQAPITVRECTEVGISICLLAPCKVVYVFVVALIALVPSSRFVSRRQEIAIKSGAILIPILIILLVRAGSLLALSGVSVSGETALDHRGTEVGYFYTLSDVLGEPVKFIIMYLRTFVSLGSFYLSSMVGTTLGWFQAEIVAPDYFEIALVVLLLLSTISSLDDSEVLSTPVRLIAVGAFVLCAVAVIASMLLGWTFNNEQVISGVQGRYFLPLLPLLLVAVRTNKLRCTTNMRSTLVCALSTVNALYIIRTFAIALTI